MRPTGNDSKQITGEFKLLTAKRAAVLERLAQGRTSKEIAASLEISESAVNRHIEIMRSRFGGITRLELARRYREATRAISRPDAAAETCVETSKQKIDLAGTPATDERPARDGARADLAFRDSLAMKIEAPWVRPEEPRVVPGVLDGENAMLARGTAIAIMLLAIIASLVLGLAAALAITEALGN